MAQKPKFSLEQFNAKHVIPTKAQQSLVGGTLTIIGDGSKANPIRFIYQYDGK